LNGDFLQTPFSPATFSAITAISVIEHGFQPENLLREISRLLMPGGYFIASVDYWPMKIDTTGVQVFDLDWVIFSEEEVEKFFDLARSFGFTAVGAMDYRAQDAVVKWNNKEYTFAWLVLQKRLGT
jgi:SAM-dependent methyltransferase